MPSSGLSSGRLVRFETSPQGTFGRFQFGDLFLFSGELPWRDNLPNVSCIPKGRYWAQVTYSPHFGRGLYLLSPTTPRLGIRIHPANLMGDTSKGFRSQLNGCIALGEQVGWMDRQKCVLLSAPAVRRLTDATRGRPFQLDIEEGF